LNGSCVPHIEVTCRRTTKFLGSSLVLHARTDAARASFIWKWTAGSQLSPGDLGNPLGADAYTLCIFRATRPTCCSSGRPRWPAARAVRNPAGERGWMEDSPTRTATQRPMVSRRSTWDPAPTAGHWWPWRAKGRRCRAGPSLCPCRPSRHPSRCSCSGTAVRASRRRCRPGFHAELVQGAWEL